jgi:hypothetical protein
MNGSNQRENPDSLDRLLSNLPDEPVPVDLTARICANILAHHRRHIAFHFGMSVLLAITGIWLALPGLTDMLQSLALPDNGWMVVSALIEMTGAGAARLSADLIGSLTNFQADLSNPFNGAAWIGIIALASGCLIALEQMLPRSEV